MPVGANAARDGRKDLENVCLYIVIALVEAS